jgi:Lrp/AsnC family transcriptional regulator for asnA, asnC and gidA
MISKGLLQVSAIINPEAFGLTMRADVWIEVESDSILAVAKKLTEFENITYVACGIGENDISIQLVAKDTSEIYHFITDTVRKVPGVRKTTTSIVPIILKDVYQWRLPENGIISIIQLIRSLHESRWSEKPIYAKARSKSDTSRRELKFPFLG